MSGSDEQAGFAERLAEGVRRPRTVRSLARGTLLTGASWFRRSPRGAFLRCLFCHYVFDDQARAFELAIAALCREGTFVTTERCLEMIEGRAPIDGPCFHLSFDDGFRNIVRNAAPVLRRHQVPALFFVPTDYVEAPAARETEGFYVQRRIHTQIPFAPIHQVRAGRRVQYADLTRDILSVRLD